MSNKTRSQTQSQSTHFDWKFYINFHQDLIDNGINDEKSALDHWQTFGQKEGRLMNETQCEGLDKFDWKYYITKYPDLIENGVTNKISAYKHWIQHGKSEMRFFNNEIELLYKTFDWDFYLKSYLDLKNSDIKTKKNAFKHWIETGKDEKRYIKTHNDFDWEYYKSYYDLTYTNVINSREDALEHYLDNKVHFPFKNKEMEDDYNNFDWDKYITYYNILEDTKDGAYHYWLNIGKDYAQIFFKFKENDKSENKDYSEFENKEYIEYFENNINEIPNEIPNEISNSQINLNMCLTPSHKINRLGVAISVYSNNKTSLSRILCSKICLNSIVQKMKNSIIIIVIDGLIQNNHINFIKELDKEYSNVRVYMNNENFGIAKTKNICIKLLEYYDIDYLCLLDDDVEIIRDFSDYVEDVFHKVPDIPLLTNFNPYIKYKVNDNYLIKFIETNNFFGNLLIINRKYLSVYGYMAEFEYKWGDEHVEFTHRYLDKTSYKNFALNFDNYIINEQIINGQSSLHMHSIIINKDGVNKNHEKMISLLENIQYINFNLDLSEIKKIDHEEKNNRLLYKNNKMSNLVVTIMAAGEGKRMKSDIPKVLHLFKYAPMLVRIIIEVYKLNPKKIIIITGKFEKLIKDTLLDYLSDNIYRKIIFVKQEIANGTAGAITSCLNKYEDDESVLILNGDMPLIKSNLLKNIISHKINTLLVTELDNPNGYGRILYSDPDNKFIGIQEEKDCTEEEKIIKTVNVGIYYFNSSVLKKYIPMITNDNSQNEYYLTDIVKVICNESNDDSKIELNTFLVEDPDKYQILGVNTKEELDELDEKY
jgi:CTP:molybdopterin cytidylyltransferase MocA